MVWRTQLLLILWLPFMVLDQRHFPFFRITETKNTNRIYLFAWTNEFRVIRGTCANFKGELESSPYISQKYRQWMRCPHFEDMYNSFNTLSWEYSRTRKGQFFFHSRFPHTVPLAPTENNTRLEKTASPFSRLVGKMCPINLFQRDLCYQDVAKYSQSTNLCPAPTGIFIFFIALSHNCRSSLVIMG